MPLVLEPVAVADGPGVRSSARSALWRARRVEARSGCGSATGGRGSGIEAGMKGLGSGGGVSSRGEEDVDMGSTWEAWDWVSSDGVSSPRRSSPSESSSASSSCSCTLSANAYEGINSTYFVEFL